MFCKLGEFSPNKYWNIGMNFTPLLLLTPENIYWSPPACPSFWTIPKGVCELKQRSVVPQKCEGAAFSGHRSNSSSNGSKQHPKQMVRSHCYISNLAIAGLVLFVFEWQKTLLILAMRWSDWIYCNTSSRCLIISRDKNLFHLVIKTLSVAGLAQLPAHLS